MVHSDVMNLVGITQVAKERTHEPTQIFGQQLWVRFKKFSVADAMEHQPKGPFKIKLRKIKIHGGSDPPVPILQNVSKKKNANGYNCQMNYRK